MTPKNNSPEKLDCFPQYDHVPEALPEGIDHNEYIIGTYYVALPPRMDPWMIGRAIAEEQSTGTWVPVPECTPELMCEHVAKVLGIYEAPNHEFEVPEHIKERHFIYQVGFKTTYIKNIPMLFTSAAGNITLGGKLKVLDLHFPKKWLEECGLKGPQFGIEGIRELLKVPERPLLNNMIKPCTGYGPEVGANLFYYAAAGGCDVVKDDELHSDVPFNRIEDRVPLYMEMRDKAREEKNGEDTLYTVNVSDQVDKLLENADKAQDAGTNAIMLNYLATGLDTLRMLSTDPSVKVPILAHMDFAGAIYESPFSGMSSQLIMGKLARLAGADIVVFPAPFGKGPILKEKYLGLAKQMRYRFHHLKSTLPMPSGGITPGMVPQVIRDMGYDVLIGSGGGIHAHPDGPTAGARAFRECIDIYMKFTDEVDEEGLEDWVDDNSDDFPELHRALEEWGTASTKLA